LDRSIPELDVAMKIHSESFILDAHSDIPLFDVYPRRLRGEKGVMKRIHLPMQGKGGVHGAIGAIHVDWARWSTHYEGAAKQTMEVIDMLYQEEQESRGSLVIAKTGTQLEEARRKGRFSLLMSLEGAKPVEGSVEILHCLHRLGVRAIGITHNVRNQYGDGASVRENYGLTKAGRRLIEEMESLPILLDLAHLSDKGFSEAIETAKCTPIISHTACRNLHEFDGGKIAFRNATNRQIQAVADKGGVVGVACLRPFLADENPTIEHFLRHMEHMIDLVGINHVGIGLDFVNYAPDINFALLGSAAINPWSEDEVKGLEDITKLPNLTALLLRRGYSKGEVRKVLGGNFLRVLKRVLG
jgi:membrane dipeptidase